MELHLYVCSKHTKEKVYGHQLTAHVDNNGVIKSVSGDSAQNLKTRKLKKPINLSKDEAKQFIYTKYGNDIKFITEPEVKEVIFVDENNGQAKMHTKLPLKPQHQTMFLVLI